jgi:NAD-dependent DNA ligase
MVLSDQEAETQVVDVIWTASKDGYLKPRVRVVPVEIGGVTIEYATGFNGKFIQENKIGTGAVIQIIRSGDVIPYINKIITPATYPEMPEMKYTWTESKVDIILVDKENDPVVLEKRITSFFQALQVEGLSGGYIKRLIEHGFNNIPKILKMTQILTHLRIVAIIPHVQD